MPVLAEPIVKNVDLHGITVAQRPSLAGHTLYDAVHTTKLSTGENVGVQTRISRSDETGKFDLGLRVITQASTPARIRDVSIVFLAKVKDLHLAFADWRPDGLGTVSPKFFYAGVVASDKDIHDQPFGFRFAVGTVNAVGDSTRFFFLSTNATQFDPKPRLGTQLNVVYDAGDPQHAGTVHMPTFLPPA